MTLAGGGDTRGTLAVVSLPPGAEVRVDGVAGMQQTPLSCPMSTRAPRTTCASPRPASTSGSQDVKFPPGEREVRVQAVLVPTVGTVEIASTPPGAEAIVNGRIRGMTPTTVGDLPPNDDVSDRAAPARLQGRAQDRLVGEKARRCRCRSRLKKPSSRRYDRAHGTSCTE